MAVASAETLSAIERSIGKLEQSEFRGQTRVVVPKEKLGDVFTTVALWVAFRASPHVPDCVARYTEPGEEKKKAVWTGAMFTVNSGKGGNSAFARSRSTRLGLRARMADVSVSMS